MSREVKRFHYSSPFTNECFVWPRDAQVADSLSAKRGKVLNSNVVGFV